MNINFTLIGQLIAFAVFVMFCMKYVWPPLLAAIEDRQKTIELLQKQLAEVKEQNVTNQDSIAALNSRMNDLENQKELNLLNI